MGWGNTKKKIWPDRANIILNDLSGPSEVAFIDPLCFEIKDHAPVLKSTLLQHDTATKEGHAEHGNSIINSKDAAPPPKTMAMEVSIDKPDLFLEIQKDQTTTSSMQTDKQIEEWVVEDAYPIQNDMRSIVPKEKETSMWVRQNLIKLGKMFGVEFQGLEEESMELLMQIDSCRQARKMESDSIRKRHRYKGVQELKRLTSFDINFKCEGKREEESGTCVLES